MSPSEKLTNTRRQINSVTILFHSRVKVYLCMYLFIPLSYADDFRTALVTSVVYSYFEKGCRKNVHATIPTGNMGYVQYAVPDTVAVEPTFVAVL